MNTNERLHYLDQLKGLAILLVVIGHFIQYSTTESTHNQLFGFIYSFHMPLFMCISGYIAHKSVKVDILNNYFSFLKKKVQTLLIPYFTWALIVNNFFLVKTFKFDPLEPIQLIQNGSGLWFLWYLFILYISYSLFLFISKYFNSNSIFYIDFIIFLLFLGILVIIKRIGIVNYVDSLMLYFVFFFFGIFISKFALIRKLILNKNIFSIFFIVFLLLVARYEFSSNTIPNKIIKLLIAVSAIISIYHIVITIEWNRTINRYVTSWGKNSLIIYATHFKFVNIFSGLLLLPDLNIVPLICVSLFFSLIVIGLSIGVSKIVELSPPLNLLLYGKSIKASNIVKTNAPLETYLVN